MRIIAISCTPGEVSLGGAVVKSLKALFTSAFLFLTLAPAVPADAGNNADLTGQIVNRYVDASSHSPLRGVSQEVDFEARLPKLQKEGKLHALRFITKVGQIRYVVDKFVGDTSVKKDVIARYMAAETQAMETQKPSESAINFENYKFKYKASIQRNNRTTYIFELKPRKKRVGLFKGELWVDGDTFLAVRESGRLAKTPSVFLRKVDFVREYDIVDGRAVPKHIQSSIDTRFWGPAELDINFHNLSFTADADAGAPHSTGSDLQ